MTEAQARILANRDPDYRARLMRGRWVVWSHAADHTVEFDVVDIAKAAKHAEIAAAWDAALDAHFAAKKGT